MAKTGRPFANGHLKGIWIMDQAVRAIFENGILRPIEALEGVAEQSVVELMLKATGRPSASTPEDFWSCRSLEELARTQGVRPVDDLAELTANFWPDDESVDDLIEFVSEDRRRNRESP
jgi:hypothetical protein